MLLFTFVRSARLTSQGTRLIGTALLVVAGTLLSSCSVPNDGWVGVGRADDGRLKVYLRTCTGTVDGATLYYPDDPAGNSNSEILGEWSFKDRPSSPERLEWPLLGPGEGVVTATHPLMRVPELPKNMAVYAWTRDASTSASGPSQFTQRDLTTLKPGQVLLAEESAEDGGSPARPNKVVSRAVFDALSCAGRS